MTGWIQNWDTCKLSGIPDRQWFGRLFQQPVRELERYRSDPVSYRGVNVEGELALEGISAYFTS